MYKAFAFVFLILGLVAISKMEPRGGRAGGRSSRSSGAGSSHSSRSSSSHFFGESHNAERSGSSWFNGFFRNSFHSPNFQSHTNIINTKPYQTPTDGENNQNKDGGNFPVGYVVSRSLSSDFLSIFNVVHDISKIPDKIKNKEYVPTTTTEGPVATYNLSHIIKNPYAESNPMSNKYFK